MKFIKYLPYIVFFVSVNISAQESKPSGENENAIEDNSFLIEESFNQEERVVQHINNAYYRTFPTRDIMYSFTQEWPLYKYKHQISYTIPYSFIDNNSLRGIGDLMINYRYQLFYKDDWACVSPRLSVILPTGNKNKGLGYGTLGYQVNLSASKYLSKFFIAHFNLGSTFLPNVKSNTVTNETVTKSLYFYNIGGSIIWLTSPGFNVMLEFITNYNSNISDNGSIKHSTESVINPGVRWAINAGRLQIVPGLSFMLFLDYPHTSPGCFFYLSFEHPY